MRLQVQVYHAPTYCRKTQMRSAKLSLQSFSQVAMLLPRRRSRAVTHIFCCCFHLVEKYGKKEMCLGHLFSVQAGSRSDPEVTYFTDYVLRNAQECVDFHLHCKIFRRDIPSVLLERACTCGAACLVPSGFCRQPRLEFYT